MPYRAQLGGFLGGGTPVPQPHVIDVGGLVDAVTGGAQGLIHQAYTKRMQEHELARQDAQLLLERDRNQFSKEQQTREFAALQAERGLAHQREGYVDDYAPPTTSNLIGAAMNPQGTVLMPGSVKPGYFDYNKSTEGQAEATRHRDAIDAARQTADIDVNKAGRMVPIDVDKAVKTEQGVAPLRVRSAITQHAGESAIDTAKEKELIPLRANAQLGALAARQSVLPLKQDEAYTAQHLGRVAASLPIIESSTAPSAWQSVAKRGLVGNYTLTPEGRQYNAAVDRAALSVAVMLEGPRGAIPQRVEVVKKTYFPQPGDDPATVTSKIEQLRGVVRDGIAKSGRGYERMDPTSRAMVDKFTGTATAPTTAAPTAAVPVRDPILDKYGLAPAAGTP